MDNFLDNLIVNFRANASIIQIISNETLRIRAFCVDSSKELKRKLFLWNEIEGLQRYDNEENFVSYLEDEDGLKQPNEILDWILNPRQPSNNDSEDSESVEALLSDVIILFEDLHHHFIEHTIVSRLRAHAMNVAGRKVKNFSIVLSQPIENLPPELAKEVQIMHLAYPDKDDLVRLMRQAKQKFNIDDRDYEEADEILDSALGLSTSEAQLAFSKAAIERKKLTATEIPLIIKEKEQVIQKSGHLEYYHPKDTLDQIGGLDNLKSWLSRRRKAFTEDARNFGLETPRGVLLLGLPGTGKSLSAKAVANAWKLPLLRLDMGKVFGGIVGASEANIRNALQTAEALSPSILWIDEIEKGLSGMKNSGSSDGGTATRVLGTFLTWMQEKMKPVFVVATANSIIDLPAELLRKGRVDEIFFVDLPVEIERKEILSLHLRSRDRLDDFTDEELSKLAALSKGFTGAELEEAVKEAMFRAFDEGHQLQFDDIQTAIQSTSPLSHTRAEFIKDTRNWAKGRAVPASSKSPEDLPEVDKNKLIVKQEGENPFIQSRKIK